jgi:hypothetical protein
MQYLPSLYDRFHASVPGKISLSDEDGIGRAYTFEAETGSVYDLVSATTITGWGTKENSILKHYAHKLVDDKTPFNEAMALAVWYSDWSARFGTMFHLGVHRALSTGSPHAIRELPSLQNAAYVFCEQKVWSLLDSLAGTADLILEHEDGSVTIHDIKTHSRMYSPMLEAQDEGVWELDRTVQKTKFTKWWKQLGIYARCLEQTLGIKVSYGSILVYNVHTGVMEEMGTVTGVNLGKKYTKSIAPKIPLILDSMFDYGL